MGDDNIDMEDCSVDVGYVVSLLKARVEISMSNFSFKRLVPSDFTLGFAGSKASTLPQRSIRIPCSNRLSPLPPRTRVIHSSTSPLRETRVSVYEEALERRVSVYEEAPGFRLGPRPLLRSM